MVVYLCISLLQRYLGSRISLCCNLIKRKSLPAKLCRLDGFEFILDTELIHNNSEFTSELIHKIKGRTLHIARRNWQNHGIICLICPL